MTASIHRGILWFTFDCSIQGRIEFKLCVSDCPHHNDGSRGSFLTVIIISKTLWGPYGCPVQDSREMHVGPSFSPSNLKLTLYWSWPHRNLKKKKNPFFYEKFLVLFYTRLSRKFLFFHMEAAPKKISWAPLPPIHDQMFSRGRKSKRKWDIIIF